MNGTLLTAAQVANLLGVPKSWVYEQSRRGVIPTVTLGRYRRYRVEAIEEWIEAPRSRRRRRCSADAKRVRSMRTSDKLWCGFVGAGARAAAPCLIRASTVRTAGVGMDSVGRGGSFGVQMSGRSKVTGFVRRREFVSGPVFYALLRLPDGRRLQRKLGPAWMKRSRPPAGYLTRAQAEARLQAILSGQDESVPVAPKPGAEVTFGVAAREWLRYVEHDRKRRPSTIQDYRRELERRLISEFGEETR
jgi:excisionase family DNA binding protein